MSEKKPCRCTRLDDDQALNIPTVGGLFVNPFTTWSCKINKSVNRNWYYTEGSFKDQKIVAKVYKIHCSTHHLTRQADADAEGWRGQGFAEERATITIAQGRGESQLRGAAGDAYDTKMTPAVGWFYMVLWCFRHIRHIPSGSVFVQLAMEDESCGLHQWSILAFFFLPLARCGQRPSLILPHCQVLDCLKAIWESGVGGEVRMDRDSTGPDTRPVMLGRDA